MAEAEITKIISYIEKRESNLSRYSDKLRESVQRIFDVFGNANRCQICNIEKAFHGKDTHQFIPKVHISIDVLDDEPFYWYDDKHYGGRVNVFLATKNGGLVIAEYYGEEEAYTLPSRVSRKMLKELVKSGRLIQFLRKVAEELEKAEQEYGEVAEVAEKLTEGLDGT